MAEGAGVTPGSWEGAGATAGCWGNSPRGRIARWQESRKHIINIWYNGSI